MEEQQILKIESDIACVICKKHHSVKMTITEAYNLAYMGDSGKFIQEVLPNHNADDREIFISGTCAEAFNELFGEED